MIGSNPPWLTLQDNGDSTATLSGTPPLGAGGYVTPAVRLSPAGALPTIKQLLIQVLDTPAFSSPDHTTVLVKSPAGFAVEATSGTITLSGSLPQGLMFSSGNPAFITGTPAVATGGVYPLLDTATGATETTTQNFTLTVNEAPSFTSPGLLLSFAGKPASFDVTAAGYPSLSTHPVTPGVIFAQDPSWGMQFGVTGLPASLKASNLNAAGLGTGTLHISGTPGAGDIGSRQVSILAFNTISNLRVTQTLTLQVLPYSPTATVSLLSNWLLARRLEQRGGDGSDGEQRHAGSPERVDHEREDRHGNRHGLSRPASGDLTRGRPGRSASCSRRHRWGRPEQAAC